MTLHVPRLHVIADCASLADKAFRGGAPAVQVRIKGSSDAAVLAECERIVAAAQKAQAMVIVNDRADIALAVGARRRSRRRRRPAGAGAAERCSAPTAWWEARPETPTRPFATKSDGASYVGVGTGVRHRHQRRSARAARASRSGEGGRRRGTSR